jgi:uncharacterized membrane protein
MLNKLLATLLLIPACIGFADAQEYFTIKKYEVAITVNKDASLDIDENIFVHFTEQRHGLYRFIPFKYELQSLPTGTEKANRQLESGGHAHTIIENIHVEDWNYEVSTEGDYKAIKIGSANKYVNGDQHYLIHYRVLNAINFFKDYSELYFNIIGDKWNTTIDSAKFSVTLYDPLPNTPDYFVATGPLGSTENNTVTRWSDNKIFSGETIKQLNNNEGLAIGIRFPANFLIAPNYNYRGMYWLALPLVVFAIFFLIWKRWGKDEEVTIQTEYYPPENVSPSVSGYIIDDELDRRDLTALIPYWGAGGYLQVKETEESSLFGLIKNKEYEFIKLKELPEEAMSFEKTLFHGIFQTKDHVKLSDLKNVLYKTMAVAKKQLETEVDRSAYYVKGSRGLGVLFIVVGVALMILAIKFFVDNANENIWSTVAVAASAVTIIVFGFLMRKRTTKGTELYRKLAGFKEFIRSVEKDRLREFLKQDEHYFDKVLPYAIVFNVADTWKDKLKGLDIPPPHWYTGNYTTFNMINFMNSLDHSMESMSKTFYSSPSSSGSSGGSFGGGGSSGGGFGGGGGSSW